MTKRMIIMVLCVLLLVAALAGGFFLHIKKLMASAPRPGPQTVSTIKAQTLEWQPAVSAVGTLVAVRGVDVTTEVAGMVRKINFSSGQEVKAGTVLLELNADSDIAQLNSLQAAAEISAVTLKRDQQQLSAQAVAQAVVDNDMADLKSKRALVAQQAALIAKKTIRAPFAGRLGITTVNPGQYLNPGDKIVTLQTIDPIYIDFSLPQKELSNIVVGQVVHLDTDSFHGEVFPGKVTAINPKVDPTTRNLLMEATIPNPQRRLLPGMFARASIEVGEKKRYLTLPQTAITYNPYGATVFILVPPGTKPPEGSASGAAPAASAAPAPAAPASPASGGGSGLVAQQIFVTTGETRGDQVSILKGVTEGQEVVTSGQIKLKNGTPVIIDNSVQPANSPNPKPQER